MKNVLGIYAVVAGAFALTSLASSQSSPSAKPSPELARQRLDSLAVRVHDAIKARVLEDVQAAGVILPVTWTYEAVLPANGVGQFTIKGCPGKIGQLPPVKCDPKTAKTYGYLTQPELERGSSLSGERTVRFSFIKDPAGVMLTDYDYYKKLDSVAVITDRSFLLPPTVVLGSIEKAYFKATEGRDVRDAVQAKERERSAAVQRAKDVGGELLKNASF